MTVAPTTAPAPALLPYPGHWESDVVLADGTVVHLRPIVPDDADPLVAFHQRLSPETVYFRFFTAHPRLLPAEVEHFTHVDYHGRVALIAELAGELVAVGCYERLPGTDTGEVALVVDDRYQGRGIGTLLLEDLAAIGRERGLTRFVGGTLWENTKMLQVFRDAGFSAVKRIEDNVVHVEFGIEPTEAARAAVEAREHRAESRSVDRLLRARSVAVVGASRQPRSVGQQVLRNLEAAGFEGPIHVINPTPTRWAASPPVPRSWMCPATSTSPSSPFPPPRSPGSSKNAARRA
jgi:GNAT superfamily N-acetyltransferase